MKEFNLIFPNDFLMYNEIFNVTLIDLPRKKEPVISANIISNDKICFADINLIFHLDKNDEKKEDKINFFKEWHRLCYEALTGRMGYAFGYKKDFILKSKTPDLNEIKGFNISGAWPSDMTFEENKINVTLEIDFAEKLTAT